VEPQYVSLDLELTEGHGQPQIIEIGAIRFDEAGHVERWSSLVRPPTVLTYRSEHLTGLTATDLETAPPLAEVLAALAAFVGDLPLVGQSIALDLAYLERAGLRLPGPRYDTFELAQLLVPGLPAYDLHTVASALGVSPQPPHRALADAETAMAVFLALLGRLRALRLETLQLVNRLAAGLDWPLAALFAAAERQRTRQYLESVLEGSGKARLPPPAVPAYLDAGEPLPPLRPDPSLGPFDAEELVTALASGGAVAAQLPRYEERPEQLTMLRAVAAALQDGEHLIVEAGTGIGKSIAYLLPAVRFAAATGRRVVVSTNTINLQDQLVQKDLPALAAALARRTGNPGPDVSPASSNGAFRVALVKGRTNYLCLRRWESFLRAETLSPAEAMLAIKIAVWLEHTRTGDRAELRLSSDELAAWHKVCAQAEVCTPLRCPYHRVGVCFLARARAAAESSHIIVVNHALLLSDVAAQSKVLPDYRYLIIDEAHHLEDEATEQFGAQVTEHDLLQALDQLQPHTGSHATGLLAEAAALFQRSRLSAAYVGAALEHAARAQAAVGRARAAVQGLFTDLHAFVAARGDRGLLDQLTLRITPAVRAERGWKGIELSWAALRDQWLSVAQGVAALLTDLESLALGSVADEDSPLASSAAELAERPGGPGASGAAEALAAELEGFLRFAEGAREVLDRILVAPSAEEVYWISLQRENALTLHAAPLHVGARLWDELFSRKDAVVLTSATLTTEGSFRYIRERLGLREARELRLGSPFDYQRSTLLYIPLDLPEPGQPYYQHRLVDTLVELISALGGRTLVLFTSHAQLRQTYEALRAPLEAQRILLLGQGLDGSRGRLLETFRAGPRAVLLGTSSFWEGVDVVGEALSCLVIARLPFTVPTDPVFAARSELCEDPFHDYAVPQAILRFKQGFGRLIRSRTDRGVVAIMDRRIHTKRYGRAFLASLPPCTVRTGPARELPAAARAWLANSR